LKILKKYNALLALIIATMIISQVFIKIYVLKDNGTFYLKDLQGDRSSIRDVSISGYLQDGYHNTSFRIDEGVVKTGTKIYNSTKEYIRNQNMPLRSIYGVHYDVSLSPAGQKIALHVSYNDYTDMKNIKYGAAYLKTDIACENFSESGYTLTNQAYYGLVNIDDKVYCTIPTTRDYTGTNSIFEISDFSDYAGALLKKDAVGQGNARVLASFSLDKNKDDASSGIEVLGLEAVGDRLALILVDENRLVIRGYESSSGEVLGEAVLEDFAIAGHRKDNIKNPEAPSYYEGYEAFSDESVLNISFIRSDSSTNNLKRIILSFDFSDGVKLINRVDTSYTEGSIDRIYDMACKNGRLYVALTLREFAENSDIPYEILRPSRFIIYAYEASDLIYKGELITDMNEDNIMAVNSVSSYTGHGFGYDFYEYRNFEQVEIR